MPHKGCLQKWKEDFVVFCEATGLHGFAYAVSGRNKPETVFWIIALLISLIGAGIICYDAFYTWNEEPVVNVIKSFKYDTSKIPAPAITICPNQYLDELYHVSVLLNQLDFRCKANSYEEHFKYEGLDYCYEHHIQALRAETSPFYVFLEELKQLVKSAVVKVEGEIDWASLGIRNVPIRDGLVKDLLTSATTEFADYSRIAPRPEMPLDEHKWTLDNFEYVVEAAAAGYPELWGDAPSELQADQKMLAICAFDDLVGDRQISLLEKVAEDFLQIGYVRGLKYKNSVLGGYQPAISNNTGFKVGHQLWRDITKGYYFMRKIADVGLGSLVRQYLPHMHLEALEFRKKSAEDKLEMIGSNLTDFVKQFMRESPIKYALEFDNRDGSNIYFTDLSDAEESSTLFTEDSIIQILRGIRFSITSYPTPQKESTEYDKYFIPPAQFRLFNSSSLDIASPIVKDYEAPHYLNILATDIYTSPVNTFLSLETEVYAAVRDLLQAQLVGGAENHPILHYQIGKTTDGLNMIPYSTEKAHTKQAPTTTGICSVLNGIPMEDIVLDNEMLKYLHRFFDMPKENMHRQYSELSTMTLLLNLHNNDIKKSIYSSDGKFSISVGAPGVYFANFDQYIVTPGTTSSFKISTQVQTSDNDIKPFLLQKRGCLFKDENANGKTMFKRYAKETCVYECALKAVQENFNGSCAPWDILYPFELGKAAICHGREAALFKKALMEQQKACLEKCPEACDSVAFSVNLDTVQTDENLACRNKVFFRHVQSSEQENEFASALSVTNKYLIGTTLQLRYCKEKFLEDIAVLKFSFSFTTVVLSNEERRVQILDQIGLIGGSLGLFNGCSLMVSIELIQLIIYIAFTSLSYKSDRHIKTANLKGILLSYFDHATIHGMQYIHSANYACGRIVWALVVMICSGVSLGLSRIAYADFENNQVIRSMNIEGGAIIELTYPAIAVCPVQLNDNWNLVQGVLNSVELRDRETGLINTQTFGEYQTFFELLLSHLWIHESDISQETIENEPMFRALFPYFVFNRDSELLVKNFAQLVLNGNLESLTPEVFESEDAVFYEINLGQDLQWHSVVVRGNISKVVALYASSTPISRLNFSIDEESDEKCSFYELNLADNVYQLECNTSMKSQYVHLEASAKLEEVGPVSFSSKCREKETDIKLPGFYLDNACYYEFPEASSFCPIETALLANKSTFFDACFSNNSLFYQCSDRVVNNICYTELYLEKYYISSFLGHEEDLKTPISIDICRSITSCESSLKRLWQLIEWLKFKPDSLGKLLHYFSETAIKGIFNPVGGLHENRMLLAQRHIEKDIMAKFAALTSEIFGVEVDISLIELPALLEAPNPTNRVMAPTQREIASRELHYALMKLWEVDTFGERNPSYSFHLLDENRMILPFEANAYEDVINGIFRGVKASMRNASHLVDLQFEEGLSTIRKALHNNYFSTMLRSHLFGIMKVMRFSQVYANVYAEPARVSLAFRYAGNWNITDHSASKQEFLESVTHLLLTSGELIEKSSYLRSAEQYSIDPNFWIDDAWTRLEMIKSCELKALFKSSSECRASFRHIPTEHGICSSFNSASLQTVYKENHYVYEVDRLYNTPSTDNLYLIPGSGFGHKFALTLDIHQSDVFGSESGYFTVGINSPLDAFSMTDAFEVFARQTTDVYIKAIVVGSAEDVQGFVAIEDRGCRYDKEPISLASPFKHYTQKTCQYECQLEKAKSLINCIPWNIFHTDDEIERPVCTRYQVEEFGALLANHSTECTEGCTENCEEVIYDYSIDRMMIDPSVACMDSRLVSRSLLGIHEKHGNFYWKYQRRNIWYHAMHQEHQPLTDEARCMQKVSLDYAFMNIIVDSDTVPVSILSRKYTYTDQLSIIGGTMGLWTGFSLISSIELCFWFFVALTFKLYIRESWIPIPGY